MKKKFSGVYRLVVPCHCALETDEWCIHSVGDGHSTVDIKPRTYRPVPCLNITWPVTSHKSVVAQLKMQDRVEVSLLQMKDWEPEPLTDLPMNWHKVTHIVPFSATSVVICAGLTSLGIFLYQHFHPGMYKSTLVPTSPQEVEVCKGEAMITEKVELLEIVKSP